MGKNDKPISNPQPVVVPVDFVLLDTNGMRLNGFIIGINTLNLPNQELQFAQGTTNKDGWVRLLVPASLRNTFIRILANPNPTLYADHPDIGIILDGKAHMAPDQMAITIDLIPQIKVPASLSIDGKQFSASGNRIRIDEITAFSDFHDFLFGYDNDAFLKQAREVLKRNTLRVFGSCANICNLNPNEHPDYFDQLKSYFESRTKQGFYIEFTLGDLQLLYPDLNSVQKLVNGIQSVIQKNYAGLVLFEKVNEWFKNLPPNITPQNINISNDLIWSNGDDQGQAYNPPGRYAVEHVSRDAEWYRRGKDNLDDEQVYNVPAISNEPQGFGPEASRDNNPQHYSWFAAITALFGGACIHGSNLELCKVLTNNDLACAKAFANAAALIPVEVLDWDYTRLGAAKPFDAPFADNPNFADQRCYFKVNASRNKAYAALINEPVYNPILQDGWKIIWRNGDVFYLEK